MERDTWYRSALHELQVNCASFRRQRDQRDGAHWLPVTRTLQCDSTLHDTGSVAAGWASLYIFHAKFRTNASTTMATMAMNVCGSLSRMSIANNTSVATMVRPAMIRINPLAPVSALRRQWPIDRYLILSSDSGITIGREESSFPSFPRRSLRCLPAIR
jgi:hypothetical protein